MKITVVVKTKFTNIYIYIYNVIYERSVVLLFQSPNILDTYTYKHLMGYVFRF